MRPMAKSSVSVIFRYDDLDLSTEGRSPRETFAAAVVKVFVDAGAPLVLGTTPSPRGDFAMIEPENDVTWDAAGLPSLPDMVKAHPDLLEVTLHGYTHEDLGRAAKGRSEFEGQPIDEQRRRIRQGIEAFQKQWGFRPRTFVPPYSTFDENTVRALRDEGIDILFGGDVFPDRTRCDGIPFVPSLAHLYDVEDVVRAVCASESSAVVALCFHRYNLKDWRADGHLTLAQLAEMLDRLSAMQGVALARCCDVVDRAPDAFAATRWHARRKYMTWHRINGRLPRLKRLRLHECAYWPTNAYRRRAALYAAVDGACVAIAAALIAGACRILF